MTTGMQIYDGSQLGIAMPDVVNLPAVAEVGQVLTVGAGRVLTYEAGGGGIAIGDPVTGGGANRVLFQDADGNLAASNDLTVDLSVGQFNFGVAGDIVLGCQASDTGTSKIYSSGFDGDCKYEASNGNSSAGWSWGLDFSAGEGFALSMGFALGTDDVFRADGTTFEVVDLLKINNAVTAAVAVVSTNRVKINVGGTDYYFLVTTSA